MYGYMLKIESFMIVKDTLSFIITLGKISHFTLFLPILLNMFLSDYVSKTMLFITSSIFYMRMLLDIFVKLDLNI